mmetsp:Transcript_21334/g.39821  ORF Transcript_21334/g.39821 Transcript_21334/m.39821 type:complete len:501 (+) Transcript_21334:1-1503(+)
MRLTASILLVLGAASSANAVKDDEYYRAGMGNPNVNLKMYWADAHNVLDDLSKFSALYVQYHNCAWSQNRDLYNGEEEEGGSGDENDYWYMGATPSFAANVAYSLYGSLQGETFTGCNGDTFINSFTTNTGFEAFASALYYAGATSSDYSQSYSSECQGGAGVVCDYNVGFAYGTFSTDTCDPAYATGISDNMGYMNSDFQKAQCVKIYDSSKSYNNGYNNGGYNNYGGGYGNVNNGYGYNSYNNYYQYSGTSLALLYYSNACFIQNFWAPNGGCPDPYGKLQMYQQNFNKGVRKSLKVDPYVTYRANMEKGKKLVKLGAVLFMAAAILYICEQLMAFRKRIRPTPLQKPKPATQKHLVGSSAPDAPPAELEIKKKRSVVGLVGSVSSKMKKAVSSAASATVASMKSKKSKGEQDEPDGIMVAEGDAGAYEAPNASNLANSTINTEDVASLGGDLDEQKAVKESSSEESAVKVEIPVDESVEVQAQQEQKKGLLGNVFKK